MPPLLQLQQLPGKGDGGWKKSVFVSFFGCPKERELVKKKKKKKGVLGQPIARATSYCLLPDTLWLRAFKNAFKVGSAKFSNSLSKERELVKKKKKSLGASYSMSNKLLLVARHILTTCLQKVGSVKFSNSLSPPSIVKKVRMGSKSSQGT